MDTTPTELLNENKRDGRGRRLTPKAERERLIEAYEQSGLTQRAFCEREGLRYCTFVAWLKKKRDTEGSPERVGSLSNGFCEGLVIPGAGRESLEVILPSGTIIRGGDAGEIARLALALGG